MSLSSLSRLSSPAGAVSPAAPPGPAGWGVREARVRAWHAAAAGPTRLDRAATSPEGKGVDAEQWGGGGRRARSACRGRCRSPPMDAFDQVNQESKRSGCDFGLWETIADAETCRRESMRASVRSRPKPPRRASTWPRIEMARGGREGAEAKKATSSGERTGQGDASIPFPLHVFSIERRKDRARSWVVE